MDVLPTLARRGFEAVKGTEGDEITYNLPGWGMVMLVTTFIAFFAVFFMIDYTFGRLLPTLLVIESPQEAIVFEPLPTEDPDSTINKDPEQQRAPAQYITSSFRRFARHLQSVGGFRGRFRGFAIFCVNAILAQWIASLFSFVPFVPRSVWSVLAITALAQFSLAWTHIVISEPSPKTWFRRLPAARFWKKVALPTAILAAAEQVTVLIPFYLSVLAGLTDKDGKSIPRPTTGPEAANLALSGFGIVTLALVLRFLVVLPANVTLIDRKSVV